MLMKCWVNVCDSFPCVRSCTRRTWEADVQSRFYLYDKGVVNKKASCLSAVWSLWGLSVKQLSYHSCRHVIFFFMFALFWVCHFSGFSDWSEIGQGLKQVIAHFSVDLDSCIGERMNISVGIYCSRFIERMKSWLHQCAIDHLVCVFWCLQILLWYCIQGVVWLYLCAGRTRKGDDKDSNLKVCVFIPFTPKSLVGVNQIL